MPALPEGPTITAGLTCPSTGVFVCRDTCVLVHEMVSQDGFQITARVSQDTGVPGHARRVPGHGCAGTARGCAGTRVCRDTRGVCWDTGVLGQLAGVCWDILGRLSHE